MHGITTMEVLFLIGRVSFFVWAVAVLLFGQITVKYIERKMVEDSPQQSI
tara:strand:+ start:314 stop:463 length:150 start_codon:yes stop_codon:yes gene_type:complete